ncbi:SURF1 family protein [Hydrogenophaga sp.]|uniref:SURF1 family protein n=1 Tax=Hydrogenophaga sp. TaxID=1904254 RepID=UPI0025C5692D|nr:SURF1 family protein [Hydrogenophaga sp.]
MAVRQSLRFWIVSAATVLTLVVTAALGVWQLDRAAQKLALQEQIEQRAALPAWHTPDLLRAADPTQGLHRPLRLKGHWVPASSVFLDNRQMEGRVGFFLVTALRLEGSERAVLVQRGWVPRDFMDRSRLPAIDTPAGLVDIAGRLAPAPAKLFQLGSADAGPIRQNLDPEAFARETGLNVLHVSVLQTDAAADGLRRDWPRVASDVHKHHGYAFQWFGLCALTAFLYLWFQIISPRREQLRHGTALG